MSFLPWKPAPNPRAIHDGECVRLLDGLADAAFIKPGMRFAPEVDHIRRIVALRQDDNGLVRVALIDPDNIALLGLTPVFLSVTSRLQGPLVFSRGFEGYPIAFDLSGKGYVPIATESTPGETSAIEHAAPMRVAILPARSVEMPVPGEVMLNVPVETSPATIMDRGKLTPWVFEVPPDTAANILRRLLDGAEHQKLRAEMGLSTRDYDILRATFSNAMKTLREKSRADQDAGIEFLRQRWNRRAALPGSTAVKEGTSGPKESVPPTSPAPPPRLPSDRPSESPAPTRSEATMENGERPY